MAAGRPRRGGGVRRVPAQRLPLDRPRPLRHRVAGCDPRRCGGTVTVETASRAIRPRTRVLAVSSAQYALGAVTDLARRWAGFALLRGRDSDRGCTADRREGGRNPLLGGRQPQVDAWDHGNRGRLRGPVDRPGGPSAPSRLEEHDHAFNFDRVHFELLDHAGRYEEGSLAYPLIAAFSAALELMEKAGIEQVARHVCALVADLAGRLEALSCVTAPDPEHRRHITRLSPPPSWRRGARPHARRAPRRAGGGT